MDVFEEKQWGGGETGGGGEHLPPPTVFIGRVLDQGSGLGLFSRDRPARSPACRKARDIKYMFTEKEGKGTAAVIFGKSHICGAVFRARCSQLGVAALFMWL